MSIDAKQLIQAAEQRFACAKTSAFSVLSVAAAVVNFIVIIYVVIFVMPKVETVNIRVIESLDLIKKIDARYQRWEERQREKLALPMRQDDPGK